MTKTNGTTRLLITTAATLVLGGIAWGTKYNTVDTMGEKGCDPAMKHITDIALIQQSVETMEGSVETIEGTVVEMQEEHKQSQQAILDAIKCLSTGKDSP